MPFANGSSLFVNVIAASVALFALLAVSLLVALVVVRSRNAVLRRRRARLTSAWRAVFTTAYTGAPEPDPLPRIRRADWFTVLQLFVQFHDIRDKDRPRANEVFPKLDALARRLRLDDYALSLLHRGDDADKILALNALGHLRDPRAFDTAERLAKNDGPELSRAAAHCALRTEPEFIARVLELVGAREEWIRSRIEMMLREVDPHRLDRAMLGAIADADDAGRTRLLDFVRFCTPSTARAISKAVIETTNDVEVVAAALRSLAPLAGPDDREIALAFSRNAEAVVALSALRVLRKCVRYDDRDLLVELTANRDYWVRLRAAEVVVELYGETGLAQEFADLHPDRYARDAVRQALAERRRMQLRRERADRRAGAKSAGG
ncbi:MAG: hypothetical protein KGN02_05830 [bacterium]|nr:hypothetical protein [bacterium]